MLRLRRIGSDGEVVQAQCHRIRLTGEFAGTAARQRNLVGPAHRRLGSGIDPLCRVGAQILLLAAQNDAAGLSILHDMAELMRHQPVAVGRPRCVTPLRKHDRRADRIGLGADGAGGGVGRRIGMHPDMAEIDAKARLEELPVLR